MNTQVAETPDRIITQDQVKLCRCRTVLAESDSPLGVSFLNPVEVRSGSRRIGWASLDVGAGFEAPTVIDADLVFDYQSPERLTIETGAQKLYARLEGVHTLSEEPFEHVGLYSERVRGVEALEVLGIEISTEPAYEGQPYLGEVVL